MLHHVSKSIGLVFRNRQAQFLLEVRQETNERTPGRGPVGVDAPCVVLGSAGTQNAFNRRRSKKYDIVKARVWRQRRRQKICFFYRLDPLNWPWPFIFIRWGGLAAPVRNHFTNNYIFSSQSFPNQNRQARFQKTSSTGFRLLANFGRQQFLSFVKGRSISWTPKTCDQAQEEPSEIHDDCTRKSVSTSAHGDGGLGLGLGHALMKKQLLVY